MSTVLPTDTQRLVASNAIEIQNSNLNSAICSDHEIMSIENRYVRMSLLILSLSKALAMCPGITTAQDPAILLALTSTWSNNNISMALTHIISSSAHFMCMNRNFNAVSLLKEIALQLITPSEALTALLSAENHSFDSIESQISLKYSLYSLFASHIGNNFCLSNETIGE